jgi:hypothetical protein
MNKLVEGKENITSVEKLKKWVPRLKALPENYQPNEDNELLN